MGGVRTWFVGETLEEHRIGTYTRGLRSVSVSALRIEVEGRPEWFLEWVTRLGALPAAVDWLHVPDDGVPALVDACRDAIDDAVPAPGWAHHGARALVWLGSLPFLATLLAFLLTVATCGGFGAVWRYEDQIGALLPLFVVWWLFVLTTSWGSTLLTARLLGEPVEVTVARVRHGAPGVVRPLGTWRGTFGRRGGWMRGVGRRFVFATHCASPRASPGASPRRGQVALTHAEGSGIRRRYVVYALPVDLAPALIATFDGGEPVRSP